MERDQETRGGGNLAALDLRLYTKTVASLPHLLDPSQCYSALPPFEEVIRLLLPRPQVEFERIRAEQRLVNNLWVKKARMEAGNVDKAPEYRGKLTREHKV